jgi:hypothetical protein
MKKWTVLAATAGVWLSAIGSAAALTYVLGGSPVPRSEPTAHVDTTGAPAPALDTRRAEVVVSPAPPELVVPTVTIVTHRAPSAPPSSARVATPALRPIAEMQCADWRGLDMGSGRVQVCH